MVSFHTHSDKVVDMLTLETGQITLVENCTNQHAHDTLGSMLRLLFSKKPALSVGNSENGLFVANSLGYEVDLAVPSILSVSLCYTLLSSWSDPAGFERVLLWVTQPGKGE